MTNSLPLEFGREAFGGNPAGYHAARPGYPDWVFDTLVSRCGLCAGASVFEIGPGTGKATRRLLDLGARPLVAIEPDRRLADFLRANNADSALKVIVAPFEAAVLEASSFDLGVCATALHWLDEEASLQKIAGLLRPGGWWAAVWNVFGDSVRDDPFHAATRHLLQGPAYPTGESGISFGLDVAARLAAVKRSGAFDIAEHEARGWSLILNAQQTVALYASYSNIVARPDREAVLAEIGRIARDEFGDSVVRNMTTSLYIARAGRLRTHYPFAGAV